MRDCKIIINCQLHVIKASNNFPDAWSLGPVIKCLITCNFFKNDLAIL